MNKYQEALDRLKTTMSDGDSAYKSYTDSYTVFTKDINTIQELLNKKIPTIEEIKKEWKKLGYDMYFRNNGDFCDLKNKDDDCVIEISIKKKKYIKISCLYYGNYKPITYEEHQLLNKLFKIWGWLDE